MDRHQQLVKYDISHDQFTDYGDEYLYDTLGNWYGEWGGGGFYSQLNSTMLYTIAYYGDYIYSYNLQSLSYEQLSPAIPTKVSSNGCLASSEAPSTRLYITGGFNDDDDYGSALRDLQVLDLDQSQWLTDMASMQYNRSDHGCIVVNERLFVVGVVTQIEVINITDIDSASWEIFGALWDSRREFGQLVVFQGIIYVIGGYDGNTYYNTVYTIDGTTGAVARLSATLPHSVHFMGALVVENTIYGFGGYYGSDSTDRDTWVSYEMLSDENQPVCEVRIYALRDVVVIDRPTVNPTNEPTTSPTQIPTDAPTFDPSNVPTRRTESPSNAPTLSPAVEQTTNPPTAKPTANPNHSPTTESTGTSTESPKEHPSVTVSAAPSDDSNYSPTAQPTLRGYCGGYQSCSECVSVERMDSVSNKMWCQWHSIDDYCYDYYTQPGNDVYNGISDESKCAVESAEGTSSLSSASIIVITVSIVSVCIVLILCIIYRDTLCMKWKSNFQKVQDEEGGYHEGAEMTLEMPSIQKEGDGQPVTGYHLLQDSYTVDGDMTTAATPVTPSGCEFPGDIATYRSPRGSVVLEHVPLIDTLLERAAEYGEYWRDDVCSADMMEEWTSYYVPNFERIRVGMSGRSHLFECHDPDCKWADQNVVLFPHQTVHGLIYHFEGMLYRMCVSDEYDLCP